MHVYGSQILKLLQGKCSQDEIRQIEQWRKSDPQHERFFEVLTEIWQKSGDLYDNYEPDKVSAWEKLACKLEVNEKSHFKPKGWLAFPLFKWAAFVVVLITIGLTIKFYDFKREQTTKMVVLLSGSNKQVCELPDSSEVTLDKNTILRYDNGLKGKLREVELYGRAYFDVKPDMKHPFIVHLKSCAVRVVGTSFYLSIDTLSNKVNLTVISGKVQFYVPGILHSFALVTKNESAVCNLSDGTITKEEKIYPNEIVWKTGNFIFEEERLDRICSLLSRYYNMQIILADSSMNNLRLTAGFQHQPLINILKAIETTLDIKTDTINHTIVLSNKKSSGI